MALGGEIDPNANFDDLTRSVHEAPAPLQQNDQAHLGMDPEMQAEIAE
jgi:hypothetical protein